MKQMNDVEILFDAINENPDSYQEIVQHQEVMKSLERWPLIAALNQVIPLEAPNPRVAVSILRPIKVAESTPTVTASEAISTTDTLLIKSKVEIPENGNEITATALQVECDDILTNVQTNDGFITPAIEVNHKTSEFMTDSRQSNRASSENISSIFERLKRS